MIKFLIVGDFYPQRRVKKLFDENKYEKVLGEIIPYTKDVDYSILNFEAPIVLAKARPINKTGPNLMANTHALKAIKYAGFNCVTLANNHFYDYGDQGVIDTLKQCNILKIDYVGGGRNINEASKTLFKKIKDKKFAIINFCEQEWSIATENTGGSNPLNIIENFYQIQEAKLHADHVIVIVHGGHEYYQLPSPRMKKTYRFLVDSGADAVINHHQHCYSGYEIYKRKPIFYGIGNFCFDTEKITNNSWNEGFIVQLNFQDNDIEFVLIPYVQCKDIAKIEILKNRTPFNDEIDRLNQIISNDELLSEYFSIFAQGLKNKLLLYFEPYDNRYLRALRRRGIIPPFANKNNIKLISNIVRCEAHKDVLLKILG